MFDPRTIADEADVIIDGYAFIKKYQRQMHPEDTAFYQEQLQGNVPKMGRHQ